LKLIKIQHGRAKMGEKKKKRGKKGAKNPVVTFADQYDDDELLRPFRNGVPPLDELPKRSNLKEKHGTGKLFVRRLS
jgi:hypothetical protein